MRAPQNVPRLSAHARMPHDVYLDEDGPWVDGEVTILHLGTLPALDASGPLSRDRDDYRDKYEMESRTVALLLYKVGAETDTYRRIGLTCTVHSSTWDGGQIATIDIV
jgi:hypothetical protein